MLCFFFFKQKTAYEMRISDWSSDVCSSDLGGVADNRKIHCHGRAHADAALNLHLPSGLLDKPVDHRQAQAGSFANALGGEERIEHPRQDKIGRASCRERVCQYV